jgi:hypothetical protein
MLRCTFAHELRRVLRVTHPARTVHGAMFAHYTAIKRGSDLASRIGFTEANKGPWVNQSVGMTCGRIQCARPGGTLTTTAQIWGGRNG